MTPNRPYTPGRVIFAYISTGGLFTLAASLIWSINTIFLLREGHLTLFEVTLVNTAFLISEMIFEVPTGVIADTIGRKASYLLSIGTIIVSTLLYVITPLEGWGIWGFIIASVLLGVGFTFQTGAVDAWMVDALDAAGWIEPKDRVFAWGWQVSGAAVIAGSLLAGFLGQINLVIPYLVRAGILVLAFILVAFLVHDSGFEPKPLHLSTFGAEANKILRTGTRYGWNNPVVRPLLFVSAVTGLGGMFVFYSWQPFVLGLLGNNNAIWVLGVVQSVSSVAGIGGSALVGRVMRKGEKRRHPGIVLAVGSVLSALAVFAIGVVGLAHFAPGLLPAGIAIMLWIGWNLLFGLLGPIRSGFINEHIPSSQRATVLSLDSLFADAGGTVGQPTLGWIATVVSLPVAWVLSSIAFLGATPLYLAAGRAEDAERASAPVPPAE